MEKERTCDPSSLLLVPTYSRPGWDGNNFPLSSQYGAVLWLVTKQCFGFGTTVLTQSQGFLLLPLCFSSEYAGGEQEAGKTQLQQVIKQYSVPYDVVFSSKSLRKEKKKKSRDVDG